MAIQTATGMGLDQPPVNTLPPEVNYLPMVYQAVRGNQEDRGNRESDSLLSLLHYVQNFVALGLCVLAIMGRYRLIRRRFDELMTY